MFKADMPIFSYTVKLDRLTGESVILPNENYKRYAKREEAEENK